MTGRDIAGSTALVTGASRGFGRATAQALVEAGARVVALARDGDALDKLRADLGERLVPVAGDATDPELAEELLARHAPDTLVLNAGTDPVTRPIQEHTWDTFRQAWETDVRQVFHWVRLSLLRPLAPGSCVVSVSSGAALRGSPLSGGYAGAKATVRFVSDYAAAESLRLGLGIRYVAVLPGLTPETGLGAKAVAAYAARQGLDLDSFVRGMQPVLTAHRFGAAVAELAADPARGDRAYLLNAGGLAAL